MYTIGQAASASGVPALTIRAWERRYGLLAPTRSESGYRLYDHAQLATLRRMAHLVESGVPARQAAALVTAGPVAAARVADEPPAHLVELALTLDDRAITAALDARLAAVGLDAMVDDWLMPELVALGQAWADGVVDVAHEHALSAVVQRWLAGVHGSTSVTDAPVVLLGLPAGVRHELGLLALACCLTARGVDARWLGPDVPVGSWAAAVEASGARGVVLAATRRRDLRPAREAREAITALVPAPQVWMGGSFGDDTPRLGTRLGPVADSIADALLAPAVAP